MSTMTFTVPGRARGQGSKRHIGRGTMIEASRHVKTWRAEVAAAAATAVTEQDWPKYTTTPCAVMISVVRARPKAHYIGRDPARGLRDTAPVSCTSTPDVDKVARAVLDALTQAGVWDDDRRVDMLAVSRDWGVEDSTSVTVWDQP